jgi:hypothetical protein
MTKISFRILAIVAFGALAGCGSTDRSNEDDGETAEELSTGTTYLTIENDLRKCASPMCGGYWVSRANKATTKCADGSYAASCYAADLDLSKLGLTPAEEAKVTSAIGGSGEARVVLRASLTNKTIAGHTGLGHLRATEAWRAPTAGAVSGDFYKVADSGIRCVTAPCASEKATKLNVASTKNLTDLDLSGTPESATQQSEAAAEAASSGGLIVAGTLSGSSLDATQLYRKVTHGGDAGDACDATSDCAPGLLCCYPCGVAGCHDQCMAPTTGNQCPLFP